VTTRVFFKSSGATPPPQLSSTASASSVAKPAPTIKRLSSAEIAKHRKDGQCFHCDEFFTNGHKQVCKQLFCIQVLDEGEAVESQDPTISIHALIGVQPCAAKMMQLFMDVHGVRLTVLLDSGSTHNFVDLEATARAGIT
jgi:hypothetical protein